MGQRGPAPKPTSLRLLQGDRKDRINTSEPVPAPGGVEPPHELSAEAQAIWDRHAPQLQRQGTLTRNDVDALALYCDAASRNAYAAVMLDNLGDVVEEPILDKEGVLIGTRLKRNPWGLVWRQTAEIMLRTGARFGLTPSDRSQLKVGHGNDEDAKERYLS